MAVPVTKNLNSAFSYQNERDDGGYEAGWFLAHDELCERETCQLHQEGPYERENGKLIWSVGDAYPSNTADVHGLVYETVDVTNGPMPGSVVTKGTVYENRLDYELSDEAKAALEGKGFVFISEPEIERPFY